MIFNIDTELQKLEAKLKDNLSINDLDQILITLKALKIKYPNNVKIYDILILIYVKKENHDEVINICKRSINLSKNNFNTYYFLGQSLLFKNKIAEAIKNFQKTIELNSKHYLSYYALGKIMWNKLKLEEAIYFFKKTIEVNPDFNDALSQLALAKKEKLDLITYLTFDNPKNISSNPIITSNQKLQKVKCTFNLDVKISNNSVINLFNEMQKIIVNEKIDLELEASQIFRESKIKYNSCKRHFEVFETFNVIPENCFSCYKVQVQPRNILELLKLFIVFDNLNLKKNLTRKCMVETRTNVKGPYKGFIYCIGLQEAQSILKILNPILDKTISKEMPRLIKRGCTEFAIAHPNYKEIDPKNKNFMMYNTNWNSKEKIIDNNIAKREKEVFILDESLKGMTLKDILVINNWFFYAQTIGDQSLKIICDNPPHSNYMNNLLSHELINNVLITEETRNC